MRKPFIIPIFIPHAGCPHRCVFCNQAAITRARQGPPSTKELRARVERFLAYRSDQRGETQIAFFGGNFLGLKTKTIQRLLHEAGDFVRRGRVDGIRFSTRPDTIDPERLDLLARRPVSTVELGVQSMDDRVLALADRGHTARDTENAVERLKARGHEIGLQMMIGLPGDDESRALRTARRLVELSPDFVRVYPAVVLEKSRLAQMYKEGIYEPLSLDASVTLVKRIYLLFKKNNIRVIRMGLQASMDLEQGAAILAGPHHPAFGHMVYSEIFFDMVSAAIEKTTPSLPSPVEILSIRVNPRDVSKMRGLKNRNLTLLKEKFSIRSIRVLHDASIPGDSPRIAIPTKGNPKKDLVKSPEFPEVFLDEKPPKASDL